MFINTFKDHEIQSGLGSVPLNAGEFVVISISPVKCISSREMASSGYSGIDGLLKRLRVGGECLDLNIDRHINKL